MGLIKAAGSAISSTFKDQWKEAIRCEDMTNDVLMIKKTTETGVISNKSTIIVAPGQCAIIYDNGKVIDATAEEGVYTFDNSSSPSFFAGQFGAVFKEMWQRFTYDGASSKQQAVFFFNIKEIIDNKFGTPAPIMYNDWSHPTKNEITNSLTPLLLHIKCFGTYTFRISNPALFMNTLAGTDEIYKRESIVEQIKSEVRDSFQNVINELGTEKYKVGVGNLQSQTDEIEQMMQEKVFDQKIRERGLEIVSFTIEPVTMTEESQAKIDNYEVMTSSHLQQGRINEAYANAMENAAANSSGALNGFMGLGIMNMATGGNMVGAISTPIGANLNKQDTSKTETWLCECGHENDINSKFCGECGKAKPVVKTKKCPKCGTEVGENTKFCGECGEKMV